MPSKPELVLVMDDEPAVCDSIKALLLGRGYRVITTGSCEDAIDLVSHFYPNLVLADVNMPCQSGLDFIQELVVLGLLEDVPVIFVSALARVQDIEAGMRAGAKDYITKPFTPETLFESVEKHIRKAA
ncbi:MAG: response regulator [Candidatus Sumerlaeaceae bacterium]